MCQECGCHAGGTDGDDHGRHAEGDHHHEHGEIRTIQVATDILAHNNRLAEENRRWLRARGVHAINLISSPGSGKTLLLERTLEYLQARGIASAVIVGDLQTDRDAQRLRGRGALVEQIETIQACHLDAHRVHHALSRVIQEDTRILFIENVGNLVCPATFDLGETDRVVLLSLPEGDDKPLKYPVPFQKCTAVVITKIDLAPHLVWDRKRCLDDLADVALPGTPVFELSALTGQGMEAWVDHVVRHLRQPL